MLPVVCAVFYFVAAVAVVVVVAAGLMETVQNWSHTPSNNKMKINNYHFFVIHLQPPCHMFQWPTWHFITRKSKAQDLDKTSFAVPQLECQTRWSRGQIRWPRINGPLPGFKIPNMRKWSLPFILNGNFGISVWCDCDQHWEFWFYVYNFFDFSMQWCKSI